MPYARMSGQLQNSRTLNKIVYANQLGSIESGTNGGQFIYYTDEGIPTSTPNFTVTQPPLGAPAIVNLTGELNATDINATNMTATDTMNVGGTLLQGPGASTAPSLNPGNAVLAYRNPGQNVEIGADIGGFTYIDFHSFPGSTADYDTRLLSIGGSPTGATSGIGDLVVEAKNFIINGDFQLNSGPAVYRAYPVSQYTRTFVAQAAETFTFPVPFQGYWNTYAWNNNGNNNWGQGFLSRTTNGTAPFWWLLAEGAEPGAPNIGYFTDGPIGARIVVSNNTGRAISILINADALPQGDGLP